MNEHWAELVGRCQRGDADAFARLVTESQSSVYNIAYSVLRNRDEAQDMTQEVYLRVWRALPGFRGEAQFSTWLYRVTVNACLNRRRQLRADLLRVDGEGTLDRAVGNEPDPALTAQLNQRNEWVWAAVDRLPVKYRLVITLFYQQQLSHQEISALLAIPVGTVKVHLNRARQALAKGLQRSEMERHDTL